MSYRRLPVDGPKKRRQPLSFHQRYDPWRSRVRAEALGADRPEAAVAIPRYVPPGR